MVYRNYNRKRIVWLLVFYFVVGGLLFSRLILQPKVLIPSGAQNFGKNINQKELQKGVLKLKDRKINIQIAENDAEWYQGLSDRDNLCSECGMYFIFPAKDKLDFVMRNMNFPLDIIFIADDKIINIAENLAPEGTRPRNIYSSNEKANRVLEVNAGYCNKYGIKAGDSVLDLKIN